MKGLQLQRSTLLVLAAIVVAGYLFAAVTPFIYGLLALHALRGPKQAIEALSIMFIMLMGNSAVISGGAKSLRWFVLVAGFLGVMLSSAKQGQATSPIVAYIWIFFLLMLPVSLTISQMPAISAFKLISFFMGTCTVFYGFRKTVHLKAYWKNWFTTIFTFLVVGSFLVFPLGAGYVRSAGFQGLFNHPQTLGPVGAIIAVWFIGIYIFSREKKDLIFLLLGGASVVLIFFSLARIGLAMIAGGFLLGYLVFTISGKVVRIPPAGRNIIIASSILFITALVYNSEGIINYFIDFFQKSADSTEVADVVYESRGFLIEASMQNFYRFPVLGIGFGVPTDYESGFGNIETFMGIPTGASIEKGFMPSAILEETGSVGAILTLLLIIALISVVNRYNQFHLLWLLMTVFLINVGEAVLFSFGGLGLFAWLMIGFCYNQSLHDTPRIRKTPSHENPLHRRGAPQFHESGAAAPGVSGASRARL